MTHLTYTKCLDAMFKMQRFGIKLGLDIIAQILKAMSDPQDNFNAIHIAGTNGKGSVAAMLATIFCDAGIPVGCYTSPHLERFNERITINNTPISDDQVVQAYERVMSVQGLSRTATFFEINTAMAFGEFGRQGVQWAIVETGMGGRLDATNILKPALSIITNISMEHQDYLGASLHAIAGEKAGIIKHGIPVVTGVHQKSALKAIMSKAGQEIAPVYRYGDAFRSRKPSGDTRTQYSGFNYYGIQNRWPHIELSLEGDHQIRNASLALAACEVLNLTGKTAFSEETIRQGIKHTQWPGRLELVSRSPDIILDGAHNFMSARTLRHYLATHYGDRKITMVVGILDDKPYRSIMKDLTALSHRVIVTQPIINRALPVQRLVEITAALGIEAVPIANVADAVKHAVAISKPDEVICIAGSLYVVGEAKTALTTMGVSQYPIS